MFRVLLLIRGRFKSSHLLFLSIDLSLVVVGLLVVAPSCTPPLSYRAYNSKETLTALADERETAVSDFFG